MLNRRNAILVFVLALLLRLGFLGITAPEPAGWEAMDSVIYIGLAKGILATGEYKRLSDDGSLYTSETERVPGYALYLLSFFALFGDGLLWPLLGQVLIGAATAVLTGLLARELDERLFLTGGVLGALNLNLISHTALILGETVFVFLFTLHVWLTTRYLRLPRLSMAVWSGLLLGAALMTRPVAVYWIPVFAVVVFGACLYARRLWVVAARHALMAFFAAVLLASPLYLRNYLHYGHWQLMAQNGTNVLYWYVPLVKDFSLGQPWSAGVQEMRVAMERELRDRGLSKLPDNPFDSSELQTAVGKQELIKLGLGNILYAWTAGATINLFTPSLASVSILDKMERPRFYQTAGEHFLDKAWNFLTHPDNRVYLILMLPAIFITVVMRVLMLQGLWRQLRTPWSARVVLFYYLLVAAYVFVITGPLVSAARYRMPAETILSAITAVGLWTAFKWLQRQVRRRSSTSA